MARGAGRPVMSVDDVGVQTPNKERHASEVPIHAQRGLKEG